MGRYAYHVSTGHLLLSLRDRDNVPQGGEQAPFKVKDTHGNHPVAQPEPCAALSIPQIGRRRARDFPLSKGKLEISGLLSSMKCVRTE